jgi:hypothetical protein
MRALLLALIAAALAGCASTPAGIASGDPVQTIRITGAPQAVADCIVGEAAARGLTGHMASIRAMRTADAHLVVLSGCTLLGCGLNEVPGAALRIADGELGAYRIPVEDWPDGMAAVVEACAAAE